MTVPVGTVTVVLCRENSEPSILALDLAQVTQIGQKDPSIIEHVPRM